MTRPKVLRIHALFLVELDFARIGRQTSAVVMAHRNLPAAFMQLEVRIPDYT